MKRVVYDFEDEEESAGFSATVETEADEEAKQWLLSKGIGFGINFSTKKQSLMQVVKGDEIWDGRR